MARASCHNLQVSLGNGLDMRNIAVGNYSPMFVEGVFFYFLPWDFSPVERWFIPGKNTGGNTFSRWCWVSIKLRF